MLNYIDLDDKELLRFLQSDDELAFSELYNRYWKKLFIVAVNKLNNITAAQEIVKDTFLDLWRSRKQVEITSKLLDDLLSIIKYKIINLLIKKNKELIYEIGNPNSAADLAENYWILKNENINVEII